MPETNNNGDPFYVGYLPRAPAPHARTTRASAGVLAVLCAAVAAAAVALQTPPGTGHWSSDEPVDFTGLLTLHPYPLLMLPGEPAPVALVVAAGKHGAADRLRPLDGRVVRLRGTRISRDGRLMIELLDADSAAAPSEVLTMPDVRPIDLGGVAVRGEVIDPKCYLGAMKPGSGKTHRACAVRCISGGIPPMLISHEPNGSPVYYLLTDAAGNAANDAILPYVGDVVDARGRLSRVGDMLVLAADPAAIRRP
jgi:hypothetical protein